MPMEASVFFAAMNAEVRGEQSVSDQGPAGAGAINPRLISFTGERCVPWINAPELIYEHYHRYLLASRFVSGKRVLDLASGEGYGVDLLSRTAADVVGIDIDSTTVEHAQLHYGRANARFTTGSILELERQFAAQSFDVVTCFEAIEHVVDHERLLDGVDHVLDDNGMFFVSTPDREPYRAQDGLNPYHVHELDVPEMRALLLSHFPHVRIWEQRFITGSLMVPEDAGRDRTLDFAFERRGPTWEQVETDAAPYQVAVATRRAGDLPAAVSWLHDRGRELANTNSTTPTIGLSWTDDPLEAQRRLAILDVAYGRLGEELSAHVLASLNVADELEAARGQARDSAAEITTLRDEIARLRHEIDAVTGSKGWRSVLLIRAAADRARRYRQKP